MSGSTLCVSHEKRCLVEKFIAPRESNCVTLPHDSTTEYLKKLKLLLNKSQAQIQALAANRRAAAATAAAAKAAAGAAPTQASTSIMPVSPGNALGETKYYVEVDSNAGKESSNGSLPSGPALGMMIQRPPIAPGALVEAGSWAPNKKSADYALMFQNASIAMAVASLDGKFVDCNSAFSIISGYSNGEVLQRSVFDLTPAEDCQELMSIVGKMMESPAESAKHFWKRCCFENRDCHCFVSMWLVRKASGEPVFFQCAVLPLEDYPMASKSVTHDASSVPDDGNAIAGPAGERECYLALEDRVETSEANALLQPPQQQLEHEQQEMPCETEKQRVMESALDPALDSGNAYLQARDDGETSLGTK
jgi:PAS domain S-box-containing protein